MKTTKEHGKIEVKSMLVMDRSVMALGSAQYDQHQRLLIPNESTQ